MKHDSLDALNDEELKAVITRAQEVLKMRDEERKAKALNEARALQTKALNEARALLAAAGLSLKDLGGKGKNKTAKPAPYKGGQMYQHPANKELVWTAKGKKPGWLTALEAEGKTAVEMHQ